MNIKEIKISSIKPYKLNAKRHPKEQVEGISESIKRFGFTQPLVLNKDNEIIIGHGRLEAAKLVGLNEVPCVVLDQLSESEVKALRLIDNRIAETPWDLELLNVDLDSFEFDFSSFNVSFDDLLAELERSDEDSGGLIDDDEIPELEEKDSVVKLGQIWELGDHRLMCGDSIKKEDVEKLLDNKEPYLMITDPPYGVEYDASWRKKIKGKEKNKIASGKVLNDNVFDWTKAYQLSPSKVAYVWHAGKYSCEVGENIKDADFEIRAEIIWNKSSFPISRGHYHWKHESCWYAVKNGSVGNWAGDRKQTTVWDINRNQKNENGHSTEKPVECMLRPIQNHDGDVYEPFCGSGSTLIACEKAKRKCFAMELNPKYCDIIIKRWQEYTGKEAKLLNG